MRVTRNTQYTKMLVRNNGVTYTDNQIFVYSVLFKNIFPYKKVRIYSGGGKNNNKQKGKKQPKCKNAAIIECLVILFFT